MVKHYIEAPPKFIWHFAFQVEVVVLLFIDATFTAVVCESVVGGSSEVATILSPFLILVLPGADVNHVTLEHASNLQ